ncbi:uroporphyrinogen-III synthase [uncultured Pelagimonas sp.]|uniref:uroporphyrinogen-III synthase n=1 Tax=uncultured Pelagimonas sp. TaxID=1618102 RepID=UPI002605374A|nr:uroporphyrinogen-III synthase [uncultured Pelagimonas sp.]
MHKPKPILLMTRPEAAAQRFLANLGGAWACETILSPLIGIDYVPEKPSLDGVRGLIFTSAHGVAALGNTADGPPLPAYVVGQNTAQAARDSGWDVRQVYQNADALVRALIATLPPAPLLHIRGVYARGDVAARLSDAGIRTIDAILYDQPEIPLSKAARDALVGEIPVIAPVFSPRTAALLAKNRIKAPLLVAAMSEAVAKPLLSLHITELKIAVRPESAEMTRLVTDLLKSASAWDYGPGH